MATRINLTTGPERPFNRLVGDRCETNNVGYHVHDASAECEPATKLPRDRSTGKPTYEPGETSMVSECGHYRSVGAKDDGVDNMGTNTFFWTASA